MKKIVVLFSVLCLCVSMIGCGNKKEEERIAELEERIAELESQSGDDELDFGSLYEANDDTHEPFEIPDDYDGDVEILERIDPNESNEVESVIFNLNEPFSADGYFEMNAVEAAFVDEVYPSDTSGYYKYYADEEGYTYFTITGTVTNTHSSMIDLKFKTQLEAVFNGTEKFYGSVEVQNDDGHAFFGYEMEPGVTRDFVMLFSIPDSVVENFQDATVKLGFIDFQDVHYSMEGMTHIYEIYFQ